MKKTYPIWLVLFIGLWVAAILMAGGRIAMFMNVPALAVVVVATAVMLFASYSPGELVRAFTAAYGGVSRDRLEDALVCFESMERYLIVAGILGFFVGAITLLSNLRDAATLGSGTALALMTVFYGLILDLAVAVPFKAAVKRHLAAA